MNLPDRWSLLFNEHELLWVLQKSEPDAHFIMMCAKPDQSTIDALTYEGDTNGKDD